MVGTNCSAGAITLGHLPLHPGYYRPSPTSLDVRKCPDAQSNCSLSTTTGGCAHSSSGCRGGAHTHVGSTCAATLAGPFCLLCANQSDQYYVAADSDAVAHCAPCDHVPLHWTIALGTLAVVLPLAALSVHRCLHSPWCRTIRAPVAVRLGAVAAFVEQHSLATKLKILVGLFQIATQIEPVVRMPSRATLRWSRSTDPWVMPCPISCLPLSPTQSSVDRDSPPQYDLQLPTEVAQLLNTIQLGISLALDVVPLVCFGAGGYYKKLLFWLSLPFGLIACTVIASVAALWLRRQRCSLSSALLNAAPAALRLLFLCYPIVSAVAFKAFVCYDFTGGAYLIADVSIVCGSEEHAAAKRLACVAIALYPVGNMLLVGALLVRARAAIIERMETKLSVALAFLWAEFSPSFYFWEVSLDQGWGSGWGEVHTRGWYRTEGKARTAEAT